MKTKVSELTGEKLAEWTARAQEWEWRGTQCGEHKPYWRHPSVGYICDVAHYRPDINGAQAMELVTAFRIMFSWTVNRNCMATTETLSKYYIGETPEIAICRAVVASVYGEYVVEDE